MRTGTSSASSFSRNYPTALMRHECGHLIVARALGFETGEIVLKLRHAGAGIDIFPSIPDITALCSFIERRIKVLFAGAMAESLNGIKFDNVKTNKLLVQTANNDFAKIRENLRILTGALFPDCSKQEFGVRLSEVNDRVYHEAADIVTANAVVITELCEFFKTSHEQAVRARTAQAEVFQLNAQAIDGFLTGKTISQGAAVIADDTAT